MIVLQELKEQANKLKAEGNESFKSGGMISARMLALLLLIAWLCLFPLLRV